MRFETWQLAAETVHLAERRRRIKTMVIPAAAHNAITTDDGSGTTCKTPSTRIVGLPPTNGGRSEAPKVGEYSESA